MTTDYPWINKLFTIVIFTDMRAWSAGTAKLPQLTFRVPKELAEGQPPATIRLLPQPVRDIIRRVLVQDAEQRPSAMDLADMHSKISQDIR